MDSILNWYVEEGTIFKGGSGSGINLSNIRSSAELLKGGGTASGPVSFMRGADASAGTIKSGGKTRRAAKMVILNADHPDIEEFIWVKAREEKKIRVLEEAGFDMSLDGKDMASVQYQNANNSVRVTDEFMQAVVDDADWHLRAVTNGDVVKTVKARDLMRQISQAAWECADPGMQFDTTINHWHTAANTGRINGSNPCSEYMHLDNSACNLASINLLKFLDLSDDEGAGTTDTFDVEGFKHAVEVIFTGQEIIVGRGRLPHGVDRRHQPSLPPARHRLRQPRRAADGARPALRQRRGPRLRRRHHLADDRPLLRHLRPHRRADGSLRRLRRERGAHAPRPAPAPGGGRRRSTRSSCPPTLLSAAQQAWDDANELAAAAGVRNSQASVLAPTGTIGLMMDCDTTGIEPDLGLCKVKKLVGGGTMQIVNQTVPRALARLGYTPEQAAEIIAYIDENKSILGAPHLAAEHVAVFACSMGDNTIHHSGHVRMMAAVQPFISGAISKTVNMPEDATVEEVEQLHIDAWQLGVKAIAIYRDNCKVAQPLSTAKKEAVKDELAEGLVAAGAEPQVVEKIVERVVEKVIKVPTREKLPRNRTSRTFEFRVADCKGFVTVGEYADGRPGEIFLRISKQGSTLAGIMDAFAVSVSYGLQYGVPLRVYVETLTNTRFEPAGMTDDPDLRIASSIFDYIFRRLAVDYLSLEERSELNILTTGERTQPTLPGVEETVTETRQGTEMPVRPAEPRRQQPAARRPQRRPEGAQPPRAGRGHRPGAGQAVARPSRPRPATATPPTACSAASRCSAPAPATPAPAAAAPAAAAERQPVRRRQNGR